MLQALDIPIPGILSDLATEVSTAGGRLVVVGGAVRDALLGNPPTDFDCEVFGLPATDLERVLRSRFRFDAVGRSFCVYKLKGQPIDVAIPRTESRTGTRHTDFEVRGDPNLTFEEAAVRRDFTINAVSWDPLTREVIDPVGGATDLARRVLRHVSAKFSEDPLRVLRGAQFIARFLLAPDPATIALCRDLTQEHLSEERLFEEWRKLVVKGIEPARGLRFLEEVGWLRFYPELEALVGCPQDPIWHPEGDVWVHTLHCLDAFAAERTGDEREDLIVGLAVLCHDIGKPSTTEFKDGRIRSHLHEQVGVGIAETFLRRITREERLIAAILPLVGNHMKPNELYNAQAGTNAIRRLANRVGRLDRLARVVNADMDGRPPHPRGERASTEWLLEVARGLEIADAKPRPLILGRDVLALGIPPGPRVGELVRACFEAQLDGAFETRDDGLAFLEQRIRTREA